MSEKQKNKGAGKGMAPRTGYDYKKWYANYDNIFRQKPVKTNKGERK